MTKTRSVKVGCEFVHHATVDTPVTFQIRALNEAPVALTGEHWSSAPEMKTHTYTDLYGNLCLRLVLPPGQSTFKYEAHAEVPDATEEADEDAPQLSSDLLPDHTLIYTLPSRYCLPEMLDEKALDQFKGNQSGYQRVAQVCDYVWNHLEFQYGTSTAVTTSDDVHESGFGVCRDFTHLAIAICRALDIPARYVFGYLPAMDIPKPPEQMDFAAWMEVWLGDRWWTFDPRNHMRRKGRVLIGRGRDASDVAMVTAFGQPTLESMLVIAHEVDVPGDMKHA